MKWFDVLDNGISFVNDFGYGVTDSIKAMELGDLLNLFLNDDIEV